jgi:hypothetical protein
MEMNDHLLPHFHNAQERDDRIVEWYRQNFDVLNMDSLEILNTSRKQWQKKEKQEASWPACLQQLTGIPVINLSEIGSSLSRTLLEYARHVNGIPPDSTQKMLTIHQLPEPGRLYMRFSEEYGRVNVLPQELHDNFGFDVERSGREIERVKKKYRDFVTRDGYIKKHYLRVLKRIQHLSAERKIDDLYIFQSKDDVPEDILDKVVMDDFSVFWSGYRRGVCGHPVDPAYNNDLCELIIPRLE